jgi:lipoate-protein ligase A
MAVDEALALLCRDQAVLRFYAWEIPTISIGYFQRSDDIDLDVCRAFAVRLVRRPTGGRAVLHARELTYSLIIPLHTPWTSCSIVESYRRINACLRRGLETLGLRGSIEVAPGQAADASSPFCFSAIARHEVLVAGKKVIGSAQRRFPAALLQQGSILLDVNPEDFLAFLRPGDRTTTAPSIRSIGSLREALGRLPDRASVEGAVLEGFSREMGVDFAEASLARDERGLAEHLAAVRYACDEWTFRR